jgi:large subunit ribosomal protein L13
MIIDGTDMILGRIATFAAKHALLGQNVEIINCEEIVITRGRKTVIAHYKRKKSMGVPSKGPFQPKRPDMLVRKTIRGMIPYKQSKGREAFKKVKCYIGSPEELKGEPVKFEKASSDKLPNLNYIKLKKICKELGWQN